MSSPTATSSAVVPSESGPDTDLAGIREAACKQSNFYRDAEVVAPWLADDPADRRLLPVADTFEVSRRIIMGLSGEQSS